ncbi:MAG TPA: hypothetical protein ENG52_02410 [Nitrososphaeria archaeon]|nr:hypothetical protein [Nitrososphaeria archaeon]
MKIRVLENVCCPRCTCFTEKERAIEEMFRVAMRGARIVICEQVTLLEKLLGKAEPPISLIPENPLQVSNTSMGEGST